MLIYRVEYARNGIGPFRQIFGFDESYSTVDHPLPYADGCGHLDPVFDRVGCESLEQLKFWFQHTLDQLIGYTGFVVRIFNVEDESDVKRGKNQVAFLRRVSDIVKELPITVLA